ncbi:MAG: phosphodiesterase [Bdellovibrionaceae bacterium]|nr:phosphodiesterase [Pseudobdellovibrionaceae bacterium]|tara:strand:- start:141858 stop:142538 length:681 start_codon:yes stop_codon:yes gene_type:complete
MLVIGHRGAKDEWPENTLLGIQKAIDCGVDGIEIDVRQSKDGQLIVLHDDTLDRTTNLNGKVEDLTLAEIRKADAGMGEKIPTLEEVLQLTIKNNVHLFIESKVLGVESELLSIMDKLDAYEHCTVICFNHYLIRSLNDRSSNLNTGCLLVGTPLDPTKIVKDAGADLLALNIFTMDKRLVDQCEKDNIKVAVWNANTTEDVDLMKSLGVYGVMTDLPTTIVPLIK